jgi:hypothetical protein
MGKTPKTPKQCAYSVLKANFLMTTAKYNGKAAKTTKIMKDNNIPQTTNMKE